MAYFEFPHTRTYDSDLGWLIKHVKAIGDSLQQFYDVNVINYTCVDVESGSLYLDSIKVEDLLDRGDEISI